MTIDLSRADMDAAYATLLEVSHLATSPGDAYDMGLTGIVRRAYDCSADIATRARVDAARVTLATHPQYAYLRDFPA